MGESPGFDALGVFNDVSYFSDDSNSFNLRNIASYIQMDFRWIQR